jgi:uncharacterized membrane protein YccC
MEVPVKESLQSLKQFLLSQYFYDGLKITFGVLLPSLICFQLDEIEMGITISLGALLVSLTDNPGPVIHKRNAMLVAIACLFVVSLGIGFSNRNSYLLAIEIPILCVFFSLFTIYGARASSIGIAALLAMVVSIDQHLSNWETLLHALFLAGGGLWYAIFSLSISQMLPYRPAEQTLGECILKVSEYLTIRAKFYNPKTDIHVNQLEILNQQTKVYESLDQVREILFKTRQLLRDSSAQGNRLIMTFIELVDLYEQTTESHRDYVELHREFESSGTLVLFEESIQQLSIDLAYLGSCIHNHQVPKKVSGIDAILVEIKQKIDALTNENTQTMALKKILINLRNIDRCLLRMYSYQRESTQIPTERKKELNRFTSHQALNFKLFVDSLSFQSAIFRHAVRVGVVCLAAFIFARNFYSGEFSYWILLTVIVILKPGFSQTKQKNYERIIGTFFGGLLGILILTYIQHESVRFGLLIAFMLLTYSFVRVKYVISVFFMTPFILITFSFIGHNNDLAIVQERILDTFIGAGIAALASYFVLPTWESHQIKGILKHVLVSNIAYLNQVLSYSPSDLESQSRYRLARKEVYIAISNANSALQRMLNEPKRKQKSVNEVNKFILLNNIFNAHVAAIAVGFKAKKEISTQEIKQYRKILSHMQAAVQRFEPTETPITDLNLHPIQHNDTIQHEIWEQLTKVSNEIKKISSDIPIE